MSSDFSEANRLARAEGRAEAAERERDKAKEELEKVKRDIGWTMDYLRIADIIMHSDDIPVGQDPSTHLKPDPEDTARLDFFNKFGRASLGNGSFCFAVDVSGIDDAELPTPYNVRHIIDICRKANGQSPAPATCAEIPAQSQPVLAEPAPKRTPKPKARAAAGLEGQTSLL